MNITISFAFDKYVSGNSFFFFKGKGGKQASLDELKVLVGQALEQTSTLMDRGDNITITIQTNEKQEIEA